MAESATLTDYKKVLQCMVQSRLAGKSPAMAAQECERLGGNYVNAALADMLFAAIDNMLQKIADADRRASNASETHPTQ